ncbi:hypothetical protein BK674_03050 [Pseudomonas moraviensis]|jgi:hypothetical protein|uniref:Uncharacterized protein n=1 Tax=Pseudomonas moraviensis TaxID=321662 RepID=A0A423NYC2_9PSED|nr:hypothetical protein BK674_03050 [Pseudomonas moraviensis]
MSGLGLREDQLWRDGLLMRLIGLLPVKPRRGHREQAHSYRGMRSIVGASLLAMGAEQAPPIQDLGIVASMDGR